MVAEAEIKGGGCCGMQFMKFGVSSVGGPAPESGVGRGGKAASIMRFLATGHLGYIGVEMTSLLVNLGHEVVGLDSNLFAECDFLSHHPMTCLRSPSTCVT